MMERLVTDCPKTCAEALCNFAYIGADRRVKLRNIDGQDETDLCEYIATVCSKCDEPPSADDLMLGAAIECDCAISYFYDAAIQAAELRYRLQAYEEIGTIKHLHSIAKAEQEGRLWCCRKTPTAIIARCVVVIAGVAKQQAIHLTRINAAL